MKITIFFYRYTLVLLYNFITILSITAMMFIAIPFTKVWAAQQQELEEEFLPRNFGAAKQKKRAYSPGLDDNSPSCKKVSIQLFRPYLKEI